MSTVTFDMNDLHECACRCHKCDNLEEKPRGHYWLASTGKSVPTEAVEAFLKSRCKPSPIPGIEIGLPYVYQGRCPDTKCNGGHVSKPRKR